MIRACRFGTSDITAHWKIIAKGRPDLLFLGALLFFALPGLLASTTFPPYYEDESWTYLAVFEALRGNGFSWGAFNEESSIGGIFNLICTPVVWISPLAPEVTVRAISLIFALLCLIAVYILARRIAGSYPYVATILLVLTPLWFWRSRYGRVDVVAIAFAMSAAAAAASAAALMAGVLSGIAVSIQPVFVWLGPVSIALLIEKGSRRDIRRYVLGGLIGVGPNVAWIATHLAGFRSIAARYFVTSSVSHGWSAWIGSLAREGDRYVDYARALGPTGAASQAVMLLLLPLVALFQARRRTRVTLVALVFTPLLALGLLVQSKNPLYLIYAIPPLTVAAAGGVRRLPPALVRSACLVALGWFGLQYMNEVRKAESTPKAADVVDAVVERLPAHATLFAPLLFAGSIRRRPDLQFFSYHSLSLPKVWDLPACAGMPVAIKSLIAGDHRSTSQDHRGQPDRVFLVKYHDEAFMPYLNSIYVRATPEDLRCLTGPEAPIHLRVCGADTEGCFEVDLVERLLR